MRKGQVHVRKAKKENEKRMNWVSSSFTTKVGYQSTGGGIKEKGKERGGPKQGRFGGNGFKSLAAYRAETRESGHGIQPGEFTNQGGRDRVKIRQVTNQLKV